MRRLSVPVFYFAGEALFAFAVSVAVVILTAFYVLDAHLNPLQLVLAGSIFELVIFIAEVPTGLAADVYSRRLSVLIGWALVGLALILQGVIPLFPVILLAEAVDGLGETFVSGAWPAWLADEAGSERFTALLSRGAQVRAAGSLAGMIAGGLLATLRLQLPVVLAGAMCVALAAGGAFLMPETARPRGLGITVRTTVAATLRRSVHTATGSRLILVILVIALIFGAFSEGIDRLGDAHVLLDIRLPNLVGLKPVAWFGPIGAIGMLVSAGAIELVRRPAALPDMHAVANRLLLVNVAVLVAVLVFALAPNLVVALAVYWIWQGLRPVVGLLSTIWLNSTVPSSDVRATVLSLQGQANSLGEWAFGPLIGLAGTAVSIRFALSMDAFLLLPAIGLYAWVRRQRQFQSD